MKKALIVVLFLVVAVGGGLVAGKIVKDRQKLPATISSPSQPSVGQNNFAWGVTVSEYQIDNYNSQTADKQIALLKSLGANTVRVNLERTVQLEPFLIRPDQKSNDDFIDKLNASGIKICLIIDGDIIGTSTIPNFNFENEGYKLGKYAAARYAGKVDYFQISNEVTGTIVKPPDPDFKGATIDSDYNLKYSLDRYKAALGWLRGMSRGVREADPSAKIVVSGHWILYDIIGRLIKDGLDFDILGWAWYEPDGLDVQKRDLGEGKTLNLAEKLAAFGKPLWIAETNTPNGSYIEKGTPPDIGELKQADFIGKFAKSVYASNLFQGFFVYAFTDDIAARGTVKDADTHWGIVDSTHDKNGVIFKPKRAFYSYQDVIKQYR